MFLMNQYCPDSWTFVPLLWSFKESQMNFFMIIHKFECLALMFRFLNVLTCLPLTGLQDWQILLSRSTYCQTRSQSLKPKFIERTWIQSLTRLSFSRTLLTCECPAWFTHLNKRKEKDMFHLVFRDTFDKTLVFAVYDYDRFSSSDQTGKYYLLIL